MNAKFILESDNRACEETQPSKRNVFSKKIPACTFRVAWKGEQHANPF